MSRSTVTQATPFRSALIVGFTAALTVAAADVAVRLVWVPSHLDEVEDALAEYGDGDPSILVLGSSHARTFSVVGSHLARQTSGAESVVAVPLEWGRLTGYSWVLDHRLRPLIEERDDRGSLKRPGLRRFILVTEWWDSCGSDGPEWNIPSRGWQWTDFRDDIVQRGFSSYNRNYVYSRFARLLRPSTLVSDRGHGQIKMAIRRSLLPASEESVRGRMLGWQRMVEQGDECIANPKQMRALTGMLDYASERGVEATIVLYPRMPGTLTDRARSGTLAHFATAVESVARPRGVRVVDLTTANPMNDGDFSADFDHMTTEGNAKFSSWALEGPLRFLTEPPGRLAVGRGAGEQGANP